MIRIGKVRVGVQTSIIARDVIGLPAINVLRLGSPVQLQALSRINLTGVRRDPIAT
jgi:hypothetical protein